MSEASTPRRRAHRAAASGEQPTVTVSRAPRSTCAATRPSRTCCATSCPRPSGVARRGRVGRADPRLRADVGRDEDLRTSLLVAGACVGVFLARAPRAAQDPRFIVYAAVGIGISAFFALRSGKAEDAFLPGMLQNAGLLVLLLVTNLTGGRSSASSSASPSRRPSPRTRRGGAATAASSPSPCGSRGCSSPSTSCGSPSWCRSTSPSRWRRSGWPRSCSGGRPTCSRSPRWARSSCAAAPRSTRAALA